MEFEKCAIMSGFHISGHNSYVLYTNTSSGGWTITCAAALGKSNYSKILEILRCELIS